MIQEDCDRIVRVALAEPNPNKQIAILLKWIIDMGKAGHLEIVPPLDKMLGLKNDEFLSSANESPL